MCSYVGRRAGTRCSHQCVADEFSSVDSARVSHILQRVWPSYDQCLVLNCLFHAALCGIHGSVAVEGKRFRAGAVASVTNVLHPVSLARLVMERTRHVMLVGRGAERFAEEEGFPTTDPSALVTERSRLRLARFQEAVAAYGIEAARRAMHAKDPPQPPKKEQKLFRKSAVRSGTVDTVGAVAMDDSGRMAVATSTGGIVNKRPGRVGDSPMPGSGGWADDSIGAVSTTGVGEGIMRTNLAKAIVDRMATVGPFDASDGALRMMRDTITDLPYPAVGGAITVSSNGEWAAVDISGNMPWAMIGADGVLRSGVLSAGSEVYEEEEDGGKDGHDFRERDTANSVPLA